VFRGFGAVVYKEMRQQRRDPANLLALVIPVLQLVIFGYAIDTEVRDVPTIVVDRARVRASRAFTDALQATGTFSITEYVLDKEVALERLRSGRADVALLFPADFEQRLLAGDTAAVQVLVDGSDSNLAMQAQAAAARLATHYARGSAAPAVEARVRFLFNPDGRSESFFVPGLAAIILQLVTMTLTTAAIVRERERGTLEQLMVTPISRLGLTLGKMIPPILVGAAATALVLVAMVYLFDVAIAGDVVLLAAATGLFIFTSLALGLLISTVAKTQLQALMLTLLVMLPSVLLSGFAFPRATIPTPIYECTYLIPATYSVEIMRAVVLRGASASELWHMIAPLAGLGAAICLLVAARFKKTPRRRSAARSRRA